MDVEIATGIVARVLAEAAADPAREVCGLLFGAPGRIVAAEATTNVATDPANAFEIDPAALLRAHRLARAGGGAVIGCYHSHPTGRPEPSPRDVAGAWPGEYWLIAAGGAARLYRMHADGWFEACRFDDGSCPACLE